ncbi:hypothetical protein GGR51DRAFT_575251 [Nemania sp. FL0031]|nr:hypothetical protein GGR51DRAFT_575251 [Nemania sp. FL0031]
MRFSKIFTGIALVSTAIAVATPQQIADGIMSVTQKSKALQEPAQNITLANAALFPFGQGPVPMLITGFADIVSTASALIAQLPGTPPIQKRGEQQHARDLSSRGPDADLVFMAFHDFVEVHQFLLSIVIGKAGLLDQVPFIGPPIAAALRGVEGVVDTIALGLSDLVQSHSDDIMAQGNLLLDTLTTAIESYSSPGN